MRRFALSILTVMTVSSCRSMYTDERISIKSVQHLKVGQTTREQTTALLGPPDKVFHKSPEEEIWLYLSGKFKSTRISLCFEPRKNSLEVIGWFVDEDEPAADLKLALGLFPNAVFKKTISDSENPHVATFDATYTDEKLGVAIEYNDVRKKVRAISWRIPGQLPMEPKIHTQADKVGI